jgi:hypothetical protein
MDNNLPDGAWARTIAATIRKTLEVKFGKRWQACFGLPVQDALVDAEILRIILAQELEEYRPAQEMARKLLEVLR